MRKILLAVLLLVLIVIVGYIKTVRDKKQKQFSYEKGKTENIQQLNIYKNKIDSLKIALGKSEVALYDSLIKNYISYGHKIDSLESIIQKQYDSLKRLKNKNKKESLATAKSSSQPKISKNKKILSYYRHRYQNLPKDLSTYEKKIALKEIRQETAKKFAISVSELNKIRKKNKLNF